MVVLSPVLVLGWWWLHRMSFGVFILLQPLGKFKKDEYKFIFACLVKGAYDSWSWTFAWGNVFIIYSISFIVISLFNRSVSSWFSLVFYMSLEGFPFLLSSSIVLLHFFHFFYQICWHINVHCTLMVFCISSVSIEISPF